MGTFTMPDFTFNGGAMLPQPILRIPPPEEFLRLVSIWKAHQQPQSLRRFPPPYQPSQGVPAFTTSTPTRPRKYYIYLHKFEIRHMPLSKAIAKPSPVSLPLFGKGMQIISGSKQSRLNSLMISDQSWTQAVEGKALLAPRHSLKEKG